MGIPFHGLNCAANSHSRDLKPKTAIPSNSLDEVFVTVFLSLQVAHYCPEQHSMLIVAVGHALHAAFFQWPKQTNTYDVLEAHHFREDHTLNY